jgi:hypothetical protein
MPAGRYYVGDLCYVMNPEWDEFCSITIKGHECLDGEFNLADGRRFATYGTAYGDGVYAASNGANLGVDAGLIGCIRVEDIRDDITEAKMLKLGTIVEFAEPFNTNEHKGIIQFGHILVDTSGSDDWDDEANMNEDNWYDYETEED